MQTAPTAIDSRRLNRAPPKLCAVSSVRSKVRLTHTPRARQPSGTRVCSGLDITSRNEVEKSSQYISLPHSFTSQRNPTAAAASKAKPGAPDGDSPDKKEKAINALPLTLHPRGPGTYPARIVLSSDYDIRVLDVEFHSAKLSQEAELEFADDLTDIMTVARDGCHAVYFGSDERMALRGYERLLLERAPERGGLGGPRWRAAQTRRWIHSAR